MSALQNLRTYGAVAVIFAAATIYNLRHEVEDTAGHGRLVLPLSQPAPTDVKLGPAPLPGAAKNSEKIS